MESMDFIFPMFSLIIYSPIIQLWTLKSQYFAGNALICRLNAYHLLLLSEGSQYLFYATRFDNMIVKYWQIGILIDCISCLMTDSHEIVRYDTRHDFLSPYHIIWVALERWPQMESEIYFVGCKNHQLIIHRPKNILVFWNFVVCCMGFVQTSKSSLDEKIRDNQEESFTMFRIFLIRFCALFQCRRSNVISKRRTRMRLATGKNSHYSKLLSQVPLK